MPLVAILDRSLGPRSPQEAQRAPSPVGAGRGVYRRSGRARRGRAQARARAAWPPPAKHYANEGCTLCIESLSSDRSPPSSRGVYRRPFKPGPRLAPSCASCGHLGSVPRAEIATKSAQGSIPGRNVAWRLETPREGKAWASSGQGSSRLASAGEALRQQRLHPPLRSLAATSTRRLETPI